MLERSCGKKLPLALRAGLLPGQVHPVNERPGSRTCLQGHAHPISHPSIHSAPTRLAVCCHPRTRWTRACSRSWASSQPTLTLCQTRSARCQVSRRASAALSGEGSGVHQAGRNCMFAGWWVSATPNQQEPATPRLLLLQCCPQHLTRLVHLAGAARGLCLWVHAMETYGCVAREVGPKRQRLKAAQDNLARKQAALASAQAALATVLAKASRSVSACWSACAQGVGGAADAITPSCPTACWSLLHCPTAVPLFTRSAPAR